LISQRYIVLLHSRFFQMINSRLYSHQAIFLSNLDRITKDKEDERPDFQKCRIDITRNALKEIGVF